MPEKLASLTWLKQHHLLNQSGPGDVELRVTHAWISLVYWECHSAVFSRTLKRCQLPLLQLWWSAPFRVSSGKDFLSVVTMKGSSHCVHSTKDCCLQERPRHTFCNIQRWNEREKNDLLLSCQQEESQREPKRCESVLRTARI